MSAHPSNSDYTNALNLLAMSASEVRREMGTDVLLRLDPASVSDTKLVELVMEAIGRLWEKRNGRNAGL